MWKKKRREKVLVNKNLKLVIVRITEKIIAQNKWRVWDMEDVRFRFVAMPWTKHEVLKLVMSLSFLISATASGSQVYTDIRVMYFFRLLRTLFYFGRSLHEEIYVKEEFVCEILSSGDLLQRILQFFFHKSYLFPHKNCWSFKPEKGNINEVCCVLSSLRINL